MRVGQDRAPAEGNRPTEPNPKQTPDARPYAGVVCTKPTDAEIAAAFDAHAEESLALANEAFDMFDPIEQIEREIDDLRIRADVEAAQAEYEALQEPVYWAGLGMISALAAQMLADFTPFRRPGPDPRCAYRTGYTVHVRPWCRCSRGRTW